MIIIKWCLECSIRVLLLKPEIKMFVPHCISRDVSDIITGSSRTQTCISIHIVHWLRLAETVEWVECCSVVHLNSEVMAERVTGILVQTWTWYNKSGFEECTRSDIFKRTVCKIMATVNTSERDILTPFAFSLWIFKVCSDCPDIYVPITKYWPLLTICSCVSVHMWREWSQTCIVKGAYLCICGLSGHTNTHRERSKKALWTGCIQV
jgi:hypothetical protein